MSLKNLRIKILFGLISLGLVSFSYAGGFKLLAMNSVNDSVAKDNDYVVTDFPCKIEKLQDNKDRARIFVELFSRYDEKKYGDYAVNLVVACLQHMAKLGSEYKMDMCYYRPVKDSGYSVIVGFETDGSLKKDDDIKKAFFNLYVDTINNFVTDDKGLLKLNYNFFIKSLKEVCKKFPEGLFSDILKNLEDAKKNPDDNKTSGLMLDGRLDWKENFGLSMPIIKNYENIVNFNDNNIIDEKKDNSEEEYSLSNKFSEFVEKKRKDNIDLVVKKFSEQGDKDEVSNILSKYFYFLDKILNKILYDRTENKIISHDDFKNFLISLSSKFPMVTAMNEEGVKFIGENLGNIAGKREDDLEVFVEKFRLVLEELEDSKVINKNVRFIDKTKVESILNDYIANKNDFKKITYLSDKTSSYNFLAQHMDDKNEFDLSNFNVPPYLMEDNKNKRNRYDADFSSISSQSGGNEEEQDAKKSISLEENEYEDCDENSIGSEFSNGRESLFSFLPFEVGRKGIFNVIRSVFLIDRDIFSISFVEELGLKEQQFELSETKKVEKFLGNKTDNKDESHELKEDYCSNKKAKYN